MAGVYDVKFTICSDFVNYNVKDMEEIIRKVIKDYRSEGGLGLYIHDFKIDKRG